MEEAVGLPFFFPVAILPKRFSYLPDFRMIEHM